MDDEYSKAMLAEIEFSLKNSTLSTAINKSKSPYISKKIVVKDKSKPLLVTQNSDLISSHRKKMKLLSSSEDLINYFASQSLDSKLTVDDVHIKKVMLPFRDTVLKVQNTLNFDDNVSENHSISQKSIIASTTGISFPPAEQIPAMDTNTNTQFIENIKRLMRKYSRFSENISHHNDIESILADIHLKSDIWLVTFIEDAYNEALACCKREVRETRRRKRLGLDLGELDNFPQVVQRLIARTFSSVIAPQASLELLLTLDAILSRSDIHENYLPIDLTHTRAADQLQSIMVNGNRAEVFSLFLSEEFGIDFLAMYLHVRDLTQSYLNINIRDLTQSRLWTNENNQELTTCIIPPTVKTDTHNTHNKPSLKSPNNKMNININTITNAKKQIPVSQPANRHQQLLTNAVIPVSMPPTLRYVTDFTFPNAPLVCFDVSLLNDLCTYIFSESPLDVRYYLASRVLYLINQKITEFQTRLQSYVLTNNNISQLSNGAGIDVKDSSNMRVVPISLFLLAVLQEWEKIPREMKESFGECGLADESLRGLNTIYSDDCALMKAMEQQIGDLKLKLNECETRIVQADKKSRRLMRAWKDENEATVAELEEIKTLKVSITEEKAIKSGIEANISLLTKKKKSLMGNIESLWTDVEASVTVTVGTVPEKAKMNTKAKRGVGSKAQALVKELVDNSQWRGEIVKLMSSGLVYNEENRRAHLSAKRTIDIDDGSIDEATASSTTTVGSEDYFFHMASQLTKKKDRFLVLGTTLPIPLVVVEYTVSVVAPVAEGPIADSILLQIIDIEIISEEFLAHELHDIATEAITSHERDLEIEIERLRLRKQQNIQRIHRELQQRRELIVQLSENLITSLLTVACNELVDASVFKHISQLEGDETRKQEERDRMQRQVKDREAAIVHQRTEFERLEKLRQQNLILQNEKIEIISKFSFDFASTVIASITKVMVDKAAEESQMKKFKELRIKVIGEMSSDFTVHEILLPCVEAYRTQEVNRRVEVDDMLIDDFAEKAVDICAVYTVPIIELHDLLNLAISEKCLDEELNFQANLWRLRNNRMEDIANTVVNDILTSLTCDSGDIIEALLEVALKEHMQVEENSFQLLLHQQREIEMYQGICENIAITFIERNKIIEISRINAFKVLYNPWYWLDDCTGYYDDPINLGITEDVINIVEEMWLIQLMKNIINLKKKLFNIIFVRLLKIKRFQQLREKRIKNFSFVCFKEYNIARKKVNESSKIIQRMFRNLKSRQARSRYRNHLLTCHIKAEKFSKSALKRYRIQQYFKFLRHLSSFKRKGRICKENSVERLFIRSFYVWLMVFRREFKARMQIEEKRNKYALVIQRKIVIVFLAKLKRRKLFFQRKIIRNFKIILSNRKMRFELRKFRNKIEIISRISSKAKYLHALSYWRKWHRSHRYVKGVDKVYKVVLARIICKRFKSWLTKYKNYSSLVNNAARVIQSVVRMWIVKKYVLNYYKWQRGLIHFQAVVRKVLAMNRFEYDIYFYRKARRIQTCFRGYSVRNHLTDSRITDIHYAAAYNRFERLLYYTKKYPELINEVDKKTNDGNTAIHSAAMTASKRTLKLLLRFGCDPNALNFQGYSPLHLVILSTNGAHRDDCCSYMLEHGFDEEQTTPDGKSCLLLACENGRLAIVKRLLDGELNLDSNVPDHSGLTCLQTACSHGYFNIVKALVNHGADVNMPGYCGTTPLHDCIASGDIDIANTLISHGAYLNIVEPFNSQTPLMWACQAGVDKIVKLYILQGAEPNLKDMNGQTASHFGAMSDNPDIYHHLREGEAFFDCVDNKGNTPLHTATEAGSAKWVQCLLEGGAMPSYQNNKGNQPSHIAAQNNNVEILKLIAAYDEHIGRLNYSHQTPLGLAKFYSSKAAQLFIEEHFRRVETDGERNKLGEIWWDKPVDELTDNWVVEVSSLNERVYYNTVTGETSYSPPSALSEYVVSLLEKNKVPLRRRVLMVAGSNPLNRHEYKKEHKVLRQEISEMTKENRAASIINKFARRKLAYIEFAVLRLQKKKKRTLARFVKHYLPLFVKWKRKVFQTKISKIQALWRGYKFRKVFYHESDGYTKLWYNRARIILSRHVLKTWNKYKTKKMKQIVNIVKNLPKTIREWEDLVDEARRPIRVVGVFEEYLYPKTRKIYFYRHQTRNAFTFEKPLRLKLLDNEVFYEQKYVRIHGASNKQIELAVKLQAMWRGYKIRSYYVSIEKALEISINAERLYLTDPSKDSHLLNYALHCHAKLHDYDRARRLYIETLRRMEWKGPDVAIILYSYCIFSLVSMDQDYADILMLLTRAKKAEESRENLVRRKRGERESEAIKNGTYAHGKVFEFATVGFFKNAAASLENAEAWHNYAVCKFLVYHDFLSSFDAFLCAFKYGATTDHRLKANFDLMMRAFHGNDKDHLAEIVRLRMRTLAEQKELVENDKTQRRNMARKRSISATKIKRWFKQRKFIRGYNSFIKKINDDRIMKAAKKKLKRKN